MKAFWLSGEVGKQGQRGSLRVVHTRHEESSVQQKSRPRGGFHGKWMWLACEGVDVATLDPDIAQQVIVELFEGLTCLTGFVPGGQGGEE